MPIPANIVEETFQTLAMKNRKTGKSSMMKSLKKY
nr:MAG TPA: Rab5a, GTPase, early endocytosis, GTP [Caudoviricetes sp.]